MKGIAKAILSRVTNVEAGRYEGTAFARFLVDDAIRTRRKVLELHGGRCLLNQHSRKENNKNDDGRFHVFTSRLTRLKRNLQGCTPAARGHEQSLIPQPRLRKIGSFIERAHRHVDRTKGSMP
jgi:hypothetical protein